MQYWYSEQIRNYRLQFIRAFGGFSVKTGRGGPNNTEQLLKVPCRYGDPSRIAATIVRGNSENKSLTVPFITCFISSLAMAPQRRQDPYFSKTVQVNERKYDDQLQRYTNEIGNRYSVDMFMPVPYDITMQVDIWTNNEDIKEQLLEQILVLFNPTINIQTSTNPIDWTVLTYIELLENINWSSRSIPVGTDNPIDVATLQFKLPIFINPPAKVRKQTLIDEIITNIVQGSKAPGAMEWTEYEFLARSIVTPDEAQIRVTNLDAYTYTLRLCGPDGSPRDPNQSPTVVFAAQYPQFFTGQSFLWNNITITITHTDLNGALGDIRSSLVGSQLSCVIYNNTSLQFIETSGGDMTFTDLVPGSLSALGLESTTYPGGNRAWWRLLQYYGQVKSYSQYGANASQLRLKTVDDIEQTNTDLVGWIDYDPVDQNILYWIIDQQSFPATTLPPINAFVNPQNSGPNINLPAAVSGQSYLLTEDIPVTSQAWGSIINPLLAPATTQTATWQVDTSFITLSAENNLIKPGQLINSQTPGIQSGSLVLSVSGTQVQIVNENSPLSSNITVSNSTFATVNFYDVATTNDIITYDGVNWVVSFNSHSTTPQIVLNLTSNRLYKFNNGYWEPIIQNIYTPGYWTIAL